MNSYGTIPTTSHIDASTTTTSPSKQLFDIQFAPEVSVTDNQQFHQLIQQQQAALMHHQQQQHQQQQQQQQQSPPQVMYDHRRDSISSSLGTSSRRGQSKAEKRAEHNAIERARREGLNTRFQQLAHVLPNLHHDTRPSKGTIIERTLDFVKDAIQKEQRYQHEIKDLRHTNRQLLKQLTHLTTGQLTNNEAMDSDEEEISSIPSPTAALGNTPSLPISRGSSPSSASSDASSPRPSQTHQQQKQQQRIRTKQPSQPQPQSSNRQQVGLKVETPNLQQYQQQQLQQSLVHSHHATNTSKKQLSTTQPPSSLQQAASLSLFSSENWHPPTSNTFWQQQSTPPSAAAFHLSDFSSLAVNPSSLSSGLCEADLFNDKSRTVSTSTTISSTAPSSSIVYPPSQSDQYIHTGTAGQEDISMKPCDFNVTVIKQEYQQTFMPSPAIYPAVQGTMRLSSRPSQSLSQYC